MLDAKGRIEALAQEFIARLTEIAKEELITVLGGGRLTTTHSAKATPSRAKPPHQKRSSKRLGQLQVRFHAFVAKNPGLRIEQINKQLGTTTKDLQLPIRKLIAEGQLKAKGARRSTTYFAGGKRNKK